MSDVGTDGTRLWRFKVGYFDGEDEDRDGEGYLDENGDSDPGPDYWQGTYAEAGVEFNRRLALFDADPTRCRLSIELEASGKVG